MLVVLMGSPVMAKQFTESEAYQALKEQLDQQNFSDAWQMAQEQADDHLGDVYFDFLYGLAALNTNNIEVAGFAFERVVVNKPSWLDGQYYLAIAYFKMANYQGVIQLCQTIITQPKTTNKLKSASQKLKQAAQKKLAQQALYFRQNVSLSTGFDSNINAGVNEDNIYLPLLGQSIALSEDSKENSDSYLDLNYQLNGTKALTQKSKLLFSGQANVHNFINDNEFNRFTFDGSVSYWQQFEHFDASVGVRVQPLWFSGDYYRNQTSIHSKINKQLSQQWLISGALALGKTKNSENTYLDTDDITLSVGSDYYVDNWRHGLTFSYLEQSSDQNVNDHISRKSSALSYNNIWVIDPQWVAFGTLSWQHQTYQGAHPFYFTKRVDNMWSIAGMVQFKQSGKLSYRFNISMQDNDSNLSLFSYQRFDIGLSAMMSF